MAEFESHPFLQPHEISNKKELTSNQEDSFDKEIKNTVDHKIFQPFDRRLRTANFNASRIMGYKEISNQEEKEIKSEDTLNKKIQKFRPFDAKFKINFAENPVLKENQRLHIEAEAKSRAQENVRLFKSADIKKITDFLLDDKNIDLEFAREIDETKKEYAVQFADATFLSHKHWKLLTGIRLFSKETFEHSIGTYLILKEKLARLPKLKKEINKEGVLTEQFLWSGLSHDNGKMAIPGFILNNKTSDHDWAVGLAMLEEDEKDEIFIKIFEDKEISVPDAIRDDPSKLAKFLEEKRIRAVEYVPIKTILTTNQIQELEELKLSAELPLKKIMEIHEKKSEEILNEMGFVVEAMLAGNHHNYSYKDKRLGEKPVSLSALHIGIEISSTLIHLADVQHALNGDRSYHHKQPMLRVLAFLVDDANKGKILPGLTAAWIRDELSKMSKKYLEEVRSMQASHQDSNYQQQRKVELELIEEFLEENLDEEFSGEFPSPTNNLEGMQADEENLAA